MVEKRDCKSFVGPSNWQNLERILAFEEVFHGGDGDDAQRGQPLLCLDEKDEIFDELYTTSN